MIRIPLSKNFSRWSLHCVLIPVIAVLQLSGCNAVKALGKNPSGEVLRNIEMLPNYKNGQFQNLDQHVVETTITPKSNSPRWLALLKFLTSKPKNVLPSKPLIAVNTDLINTTYNRPTVI